MSKRFINCSACKGCHTGRGGRYCAFIEQSPTVQTAGPTMMHDPDAPDRSSEDYESYLSQKIIEEESRLKDLQNKCRVTEMEQQLAKLRIQTADLQSRSPGRLSDGDRDVPVSLTGVASRVLTATTLGAAGSSPGQVAGPFPGDATAYVQRSREEKDTLSKLRAISHLAEPKQVEKITYREFICSMSSVLKLLIDLNVSPKMYVAHMHFIASKAKLNIYATDALIRYEAALTDRVIGGIYPDWVAADPECVALHLGADATYAVRQGGGRWSRPQSGTLGSGRDFSDWPKDICWLFNNTNCYFPRCKKSHICFKCKRTGHNMKDCKNPDDSAQLPNQPEVLSTKPAKETRKQ